jgi:3-hydroxyisobutyrate dehydrogenase
MAEVVRRPIPGAVKDLRVGFIGLGSQGAAMARRICDAGYPLTLWARRPASLQPFSDVAVQVAATPAALGVASDIVGICVVSDADVEEVVLGGEGVLAGMSEGGTLAVHSTVHPETCLMLADKAAEVGVGVVDAPVSGGGGAAAERRLLVMVGGAEADVERCRPVFETFGNPVTHLGPLGSGELAKLLNNLVFTVHVGAALEAFSSAEQLGIEPSALADVLAHGSGGSRAQALMAATNFDLSGLRQARTLLQKDVNLVVDVMQSRGVPEPSHLLQMAQHTLQTLEDPT